MRSFLQTQTDIWSFFDKIYCISLQERPDRKRKVQEQFAAVGLAQRVEFVHVNRHPENREKGIFESHQHCLRKGLADGADTFLIFEDDVFFQQFSKEQLYLACKELSVTPSWDGFLLGGITSRSRKTSTKHLVKVQYRCLTHAYAVTRSFAQVMAEEKWNNIPWDGVLKESKGSFYAIYPMCAFQGLEGSENQTKCIARMRKLFGGLPFLQRLNELYQNNRLFMIVATALPLILLLGFWMYS